MARTFSNLSVLAVVLLHLALLVIGQGTQFITGPCTSDADCASGCCGFNSGKCAGAIVAQERDGGCGFGDSSPNANAAAALTGGTPAAAMSSAAAAPAPAPAAAESTSGKGAGNGAGAQFITGPCSSDADCASSCCGFNSGKCAGPVIAQERDGGCGFGDSQPNDDAARAFLGEAPATSATAAAAAPAAAPSTPASSSGSGKATGTQFITGACSSDADCASACCGFNSGKCAGPVIAQERDGGCGFGDAQPNDTAAKAFFAGQKRGRRSPRA